MIINLLRKWISSRKDKREELAKLDLIRAIGIKEKDGKVWVISNGIAIQAIPDTASAQDIVKTLDNIRKAAIEYELCGDKKTLIGSYG